MQDYLKSSIHMDRKVAQFIFSIYSQTADLKVWTHFRYENNACFGCEIAIDSFEHLLTCKKLGEPNDANAKDIKSESLQVKVKIGSIALERFNNRKLLKKESEKKVKQCD